MFTEAAETVKKWCAVKRDSRVSNRKTRGTTCVSLDSRYPYVAPCTVLDGRSLSLVISFAEFITDASFRRAAVSRRVYIV